MKNIILTICLGLAPAIFAQSHHYLTASAGFGMTLLNEESLDRFTNTYNLVNQDNLKTPLSGFDFAGGLRWHGGYRLVGDLSAALNVGFIRQNRNDVAQFNNGEERRLELEITSFFIEPEFGKSWRSVFLHGVASVYLNRKVSILSEYLGATGEPVKKSLDGDYNSDSSVGTDVGIAFGFLKQPLLLVAKLTYPVLSTGDDRRLRDTSPDKLASGTSTFPDDVVSFLNDEPYDGLPSNLDGIKIQLSLELAFRIGS